MNLRLSALTLGIVSMVLAPLCMASIVSAHAYHATNCEHCEHEIPPTDCATHCLSQVKTIAKDAHAAVDNVGNGALPAQVEYRIAIDLHALNVQVLSSLPPAPLGVETIVLRL